jgi:hypothetical protein
VVAQQRRNRHLDPFVLVECGSEYRRFGDLQPHIEAQRHQHRADEERHAPAPGFELFVRQAQCQREKQAIRGEKADRRTQLRKHAEPATLGRGCILSREQRGAAPFAAQADPLSEAQYAQQDRCERTDRVVAGHQADQRGTHAHD